MKRKNDVTFVQGLANFFSTQNISLVFLKAVLLLIIIASRLRLDELKEPLISENSTFTFSKDPFTKLYGIVFCTEHFRQIFRLLYISRQDLLGLLYSRSTYCICWSVFLRFFSFQSGVFFKDFYFIL